MVSIIDNLGPVGGLALACLLVYGISEALTQELSIQLGSLNSIALLGFIVCLFAVIASTAAD